MHAFIYTRDVNFSPSRITRVINQVPGRVDWPYWYSINSNSFWKVADPKDHSTGTPGLS
ncbi:hypothetical protein TGAM01_v205942 [Trichoderma gamsii]|uniref:Uncharacterized protein n=1 Tax=Trichoderma gamsii TaxID=398673 RepID=A0A2P4ZLT2_9HYPO|nr:hypothetical protein TGAM01_v205942 [Trichoderma gamsii]PON25256.1 hypothetical protein TGAM01_v205942 [Trichoderma gamsii]